MNGLKHKKLSEYFTKEDLPELSMSKDSRDIHLSNLNSYECILLQNSYGNLPKRSYLFKDLTDTQKMLNLFEFLENKKYEDNLVNCRPLLHKYLYSGYLLGNFFDEKTTSKIRVKSHVEKDKEIRYGNIYHPVFGEQNQASYPKSIRTYFENYLKNRANKSDSLGYHLIDSIQRSNQTNHEYHPRYYVPVNQIPEFLFSFAYYDGRTFSSDFQDYLNKIPKLNKGKQKSKDSYQFVLEQIYSLLNTRLSDNSTSGTAVLQNTTYARLNYIYKFDRIFKTHSISKLKQYYDAYLSDAVLDQIIISFELPYREILRLEESIINSIWMDDNFMLDGYNSPYMDFMLPFDILFQYQIFFNRYQSIKGLNGIELLIDKVKEETRTIWKQIVPVNLNSISEKYANVTNIDILELQNIIYEDITNNKFYKNYFSSTPTESSEYPISFEIMKKILPQ